MGNKGKVKPRKRVAPKDLAARDARRVKGGSRGVLVTRKAGGSQQE
jgi:hypothetical protein